MKRLVICCDGTWNSPQQTDRGVSAPTNVVRVAQSVVPEADDGVEQRVFYDAGVGAAGHWFRRLVEGATGAGVSQNVVDAYRFVVRHYRPGDQLFLFGFSRGSFTARSLAGLIRNCGVLRPESGDQVDAAYAMYRSRKPAHAPWELEATLFRRTHALEMTTPVHFIGVWDTVGALGNPVWINSPVSRQYQFHDTGLSSTVHHAYQALAIDEQRRHFRPSLWTVAGTRAPGSVEQRWFAGVHSNVGGGYRATGLSDLALGWMAERAAACGLQLDLPPMQPDPLEPAQRSRRHVYRLLPPFHRPIDAPRADGRYSFESVDPSVRHRWQEQPGYRPANLVDLARRRPDWLGA